MSTDKYSFMKIGAHGFAGSGKTRTLTEIAIALHKEIGSDKPIKIFDSELGSRFSLRFIKQAGIPIDPAKDIVSGRSLTTLTKLMDECDRGASQILIIDSSI